MLLVSLVVHGGYVDYCCGGVNAVCAVDTIRR